jgi:glycosyltransferase involved in cell wall biosynthesis
VSRILVVNGIGDAALTFRGPLLRDLVAAGHEVILSTPRPEQADASVIERGASALGARLVFSPLDRTSLDPRAERRARRHYEELIGSTRPDAVFASNPKPVFHVLPIAARLGVRRRVAMITGLGYAFIGSSLRARVLRLVACRLYRRALAAATTIVFQNEDDRAELARRGVLPNGTPMVTVGGSGVDLDQFPMRALPEGPARFLMIARLLGDKGVREFAAAARLVRAAHPECSFRLVGWIDGNPAAIRRDELDGWVREGLLTCPGRLDDVRDELAAAHVFVLPSYREGMPRSTLEALATGRAVVTTDVPGCRETVIPGENGLLVPPRDPRALAAACERLLGDREALGRMGAASRKLAESRFDVRAVNATLVGLLT